MGNPVFPQTPVIGIANLSTADTSLTNPMNVCNLLTGCTCGTQVDRIDIKATCNVTDGAVRFWICNGCCSYLIKEVHINPTYQCSCVPLYMSYEHTWGNDDRTPIMSLPSGYVLQVTTNNSEYFNVIAYGGDF
jgi:hypothetical protein